MRPPPPALATAALAATLMLVAPAATAETLATTARAAPARAYELGVRVGGYGFRREGDTRPGEGWTECRMNGIGVFGTRALTGPLFIEAGLDFYSTADAPLPGAEGDLPVDRMSGLVSTALGARTHLAAWARAYVQLGVGVELTRVSVPYGDQRIRDSQALPEGFFGAGLDLKVGRHTYVGATMRFLAMGNFDYDKDRLDMSQGWAAAPTADEVFDPAPDMAAQGQFYVRHAL